MKTTLRKGFTLIELMVVIAIIGILAVTLIPQLTGAQARSRDAGRIASLQNISSVLEMYQSDTGVYPISPANTSNINDTNNGCFSDSNGVVNPILAEMLAGGRAPIDTQTTRTSAPCTVAGSFGYAGLARSGLPVGGYVLTANVETRQRGNYNNNATAIPATGGEYSVISDATLSELPASIDVNDSLYVIVR